MDQSSKDKFSGAVVVDEEGQIWYQPGDPSKPRQLLADADGLCGIWIFETSPTDPLRDACIWHDNAYIKRAFFEERGWDRYSLDKYFHQLALLAANGDPALIRRANCYYNIVRSVGWIFYYRHEGYNPPREHKPVDLAALPLPVLIPQAGGVFALMVPTQQTEDAVLLADAGSDNKDSSLA